mmetsp:Transcript_12510/g.18219  ORF Transcript_12510/g.18219 Transcript_12510/m.18219 type:complete len:300 (-) Transcript_12510:58-957(-)
MRIHRYSILLTAIFLATWSTTPTSARKALGGSGGLHTRGAPRPKPTSDMNDPTRLATIGATANGWKLPPLNTDELISKLGPEHRSVAQYIANTLGSAPLAVQLRKKPVGVKTSTFATQEKFRAQVSIASNSLSGRHPGSWAARRNVGNRLRSMWFIGSERAFAQSSAVQQQGQDLLTKSYEDNASKLYPSHFVLEVFLPKTKACKGGNPLVTYSIPFGVGTISPKAKVGQANGVVTVYPNGRKRKGASTGGGGDDGVDVSGVEIGRTSLHLNSGAPLVDPVWARGKKNFWRGCRDAGQL